MLPTRITSSSRISSKVVASGNADSILATLRFRINDENFYPNLTRALQHVIAPKHILLLEGGVGVGKTQFARALIQSLLGKREHVPSPTFALLQKYQTPRGNILHADLYRFNEMQSNRLQSAEMARELGLAEELACGFVMIEWAQRLPAVTRVNLLAQAQVMRLRLKFTGGENTNETRVAVLKLPAHLVTPTLLKLQGLAKKVTANALTKHAIAAQRSMTTTKIKQAFVFAAGHGTRMRSYSSKPKPLLRVAGKALLLHAIKHLHQQGVESIYINAHYRTELIVKACENIKGVKILHEKTLLETGGAIKNALAVFNKKPFFAINGDALWYEPNYGHLQQQKNIQQQSPTLLSCLEQAWAKIEKKKLPATILLALVEEKGARDFQASSNKNLEQKAQLPFPLSFPNDSCHAESASLKETRYWRYTGLQILTATAFKAFKEFHNRSTTATHIFSLKEIYAQEATAGRLYGIVVGDENTAYTTDSSAPAKITSIAASAKNCWCGVWMHLGDKSSLLRARRRWRNLQKQDEEEGRKT